jgi:hypothetical protein
MTAAVTRRRTTALLGATLVLATVPACPRQWETWPSTASTTGVRP